MKRLQAAGMASPGPIASALWTDAELEADVCLDAILTICDASNIQRQLTDEREPGAMNEAQEQIAYADIILCNKVLYAMILLSFSNLDALSKQMCK